MAASPEARAKGWDFTPAAESDPCSISCRNRRARARATMSGRVGDLSPKQKEALAKVSPHPGPAPVPRPGASPSGS